MGISTLNEPFRRYEANPIITVRDLPYPANTVFNAAATKVGLSPPPLKTPEGWLILYHGVKTTVSGSLYRLGLAMVDLEDPCRLIARSDQWVFGPERPYEVCGDVNKVVFPCGWVQDGDTLKVYYGGADTCIAVATAHLADLLAWLRDHNVHPEG